VDKVEIAIKEMIVEAAELAQMLFELLKAARIRLYAQVAKWHEEIHPGTLLMSCPVCSTDLENVFADSVLNSSVRDALEGTKKV